MFCFTVGARGGEEAAENRNYLAGRMIEEVTETIRVLQVNIHCKVFNERKMSCSKHLFINQLIST